MKIKVLPESLTNQIAAGEVIDRPASVVKELVENSLDAAASQITVIIRDGGHTLIQVVDDGDGMAEEDLLLAFQRHSTSKIHSYEDLECVRTLGFRGEALASIASVARVEARSVLAGQTVGSQVRIEGGVVEEVTAFGGPPGTSVAVKHLFFNTPARRKFLRAPATEYRHILSVFNRFALGYPGKAFILIQDDEVVFDMKPTSLLDRIGALLGSRVRDGLVEVSDDGPLRIRGYIATPDAFRRSRGDQYLFLNGRYIVNRALNHAIVSGYGEILPRGAFPVYILQLELDPQLVDVNVHPTKVEVKFANEGMVYKLINGAVKRALGSAQIVPSLQPFSGEAFRPQSLPGAPFSGEQQPLDLRREPESVTTPGAIAVSPDETQEADVPASAAAEASATGPGPTQPQPQVERFERTNVWQLHNKYILTQIKSGLIVIDQHVAHERILYERALDAFERRAPASQQLLFPQVVELSAEDFSYLTEMLPFLEKIGFVIKAFGKNTVVVEGVPPGIKISDDEKLLTHIIDEFKRGKKDSVEIRECVAKSFACHAAVRAGDKLSLEAMNALIDQLFATRHPYHCPHGRPVIVNIPIEELDRRFGRT
jgi:DNA mismatch repair protein MutL